MPLRAGDLVQLEVLGTGRVTATVGAREELDWRGIKGMAWKLRLDLPGGSSAEALQVGDQPLTFQDPRVRAV